MVTDRDKAILKWIELGSRAIAKAKSNNKEDWKDNFNIWVCENIEKIMKHPTPKEYVFKSLKYCNPVYDKKRQLEQQFSEAEDGSSLMDLVACVEETPETIINDVFNQFDNQNEIQNENAYISVSDSVSESISCSVSLSKSELSNLGKMILNLLHKNIVVKEFSSNYGGKRKGSGKRKKEEEKKEVLPPIDYDIENDIPF